MYMLAVGESEHCDACTHVCSLYTVAVGEGVHSHACTHVQRGRYVFASERMQHICRAPKDGSEDRIPRAKSELPSDCGAEDIDIDQGRRSSLSLDRTSFSFLEPGCSRPGTSEAANIQSGGNAAGRTARASPHGYSASRDSSPRQGQSEIRLIRGLSLTLPASQTPRSHHSSSAEAPLAISSSPRISWPLSKAICPPRSSPAASPRVLRGISQPSLSPSHPYVGDHRGGVADGRDGGGWGQGEPYQATEGRQSTNPPPIISRPPSSPPNLNEFVDNATDAQVIRAD